MFQITEKNGPICYCSATIKNIDSLLFVYYSFTEIHFFLVNQNKSSLVVGHMPLFTICMYVQVFNVLLRFSFD